MANLTVPDFSLQKVNGSFLEEGVRLYNKIENLKFPIDKFKSYIKRTLKKRLLSG